MRRLSPLVLSLPLAVACASSDSVEPEPHVAVTTEVLEPYTCGSIQKLHTLGGVFLASQPSAEDLEQARLGGVKTVINLRQEREMQGFDEGGVVEGLGMTYVHVPFNGPAELTDEVFAITRELLNSSERPILLHCASANRVGAVWIPWRVLDGGVSIEEAVEEARTIGLKTPEYEAMARDYVQRNS